MQVSWIDADRIKALVAQIAPQETCVDETPRLVELDTAPEPMLGTAPESWGFAMDWLEPVARPASEAPAVTETAAIESGHSEALADIEDDGEEEMEQPFHNPTAALPLSRIRDKLRAIRQRATEAGILTRTNEVVPMEPASDMQTTEAVLGNTGARDAAATGDGKDAAATDNSEKLEPALPQASAFETPSGSRERRLAAFAGWARQLLHEDGGHVLVMSDDGEVLWGGEARAGLVLSTMMAWGAAIRASAMSACDQMPPVIHQPLATGNVLTVIPCETAGGMVHAAVAAPAGLTQEMAHLIRGALCTAMN